MLILALATFGIGSIIAVFIWALIYTKYYALQLLEREPDYY